MKVLNKLKVSQLLFGGFFGMLILLLIVAIISIIGMKISDKGFQAFQSLTDETFFSGAFQSDILEMRLQARNFILLKDEESLEEYEKAKNLMQLHLDQYDAMITDAERRKNLLAIKRDFTTYVETFAAISKDLSDIQRIELDELVPAGELMLQSLDGIAAYSKEAANAKVSILAGQLSEDVLEARIQVVKMLQRHRYDHGLKAIDVFEGEMTENALALEELLQSDEQRELFEDFVRQKDRYLRNLKEAVRYTQQSAEYMESTLEMIGPRIAKSEQVLKQSFELEQQMLGEEHSKTSSRLLLLTVFVSIAGLLSGLFLARKITQLIRGPLGGEPMEMMEVTKKIAAGDLRIAWRSGINNRDLNLYSMMYLMTDTLKSQTMNIREGVSSLSSAISQISSTSSELAASSSENSSSISEIGATLEEVRQTAVVSSDKSQQVANEAEQLEEISDAGQQATQEAVSGMNRIKDEMESVAESIVELSEKNQSISEILNTVNDLADQSNLLSVNAAIEAAKGGEYGKGFAVVAREVKSLADQSKEATRQIKVMLNDIQKATSTAVMATERGGKAVDSGLQLTLQAGQAIKELTSGVSRSTQVSTQIAASSQQQMMGMDQLATAMNSIKAATSQNHEGAKQLESATRGLVQLGTQLKEISDKFRV